MKKAVPIISFIVLLLSASGCKVDSLYDFDKLDTEMTVMKGATFPVPSPDPIFLKDIIQLDGYDFITTDGAGNYNIHFDVPEVRMEVTIPNALQGNRVPTDFKPTTYSFGSVPDFLSSDGQNVVPDLSQMLVLLNLQSDVPADFSVSSTIQTLKGGAVQRSYQIDNLLVPNGSRQYGLQEHIQDGLANRVEVPDLGNLLSPIPDEFKVSALDVFAEPDQFAKVHPGDQHTIVCSASVWAPIAFSAETHFKVTIPLAADLNLEQIGLKKAVLNGLVENSIPLDFTMNLYALDGNGKRIDSIRFTQPENNRIAGRGTSPLSLELTTDGDLRFASLVLELTASSNQALAGVLFNVHQGITLRDLVLELPDGIVVKLDK